MADPLSVTASVAGLLSLGTQVSQSLIGFYTSYRAQDSEIARITHRLESLRTTFQTLEQTWTNRAFRSDEQDLCEKVERSVHSCEELILELQNESQKLDQSAVKGIRATITTTSRRLAYPFRQSTLQKLDEDIGEIRDNLSLALSVLQLKSTDRMEGDISAIKSLLNLVRFSQISQTVRDWLKAPDAATDHNDLCAKRHPATGVWLVRGPTFTTWLEGRNSFLWLNGFAGCGKSVLCSTAIQYVFRHRRSDPYVGIAFFYFTFKDESKQDASAMLRAMLFQLSNQVDDGHTDLTRLHASYSNGVPPIPVLTAHLRQLIQRFHQVYLMIDAVDESPKHTWREGVLDVLECLRQWSFESLHLLVTSRDEPDIRERLHPSPVEDVSLKNTEVDKDIADYIQGHLEQHRALRKWSKHHVRIREVLTTRAQGV
jgi:ankyrin repeat domain-containing protein 50